MTTLEIISSCLMLAAAATFTVAVAISTLIAFALTAIPMLLWVLSMGIQAYEKDVL